MLDFIHFKALRQILEHYEFKVIVEEGYPQVYSKTMPKGLLKIVYALDRLLAKWKGLAANILILAVK